MVTTRRGGFAALGQVVDLDVIPPADAVRLLRTRVPKLDQHTGKQIADELGRLPLALEQAAAYLDLSQMPGRRIPATAAQPRRRPVTRAGRSPAATTPSPPCGIISLERLNGENPAAVQLLAVCAYLAPEPIPLDLFTTHPDLLPEPLSTAAADQVAFTDTVTALADYSLAKRTPAGLQVHRLVQAALRARHPANDNPVPEDRPDATSGARASRRGTAGGPLAVALALLRADVPGQDHGRAGGLAKMGSAAAARAGGHRPPRPHRSHQVPHVMAEASWLLDRAGAYLLVHARPSRRQSRCWNGRWPSTRPPTDPTTPPSPSA